MESGGWQKFRLDEIGAEPWRNGGGVTRTIAVAGKDWRVSVADIAHSGAFSVFPGIDRTAMLVSGPGVMLQGEAMQAPLRRAGAVAQFAGEAVMQATLDSGPVRLWNVMTRRGVARCTLELRSQQAVELDAALQICMVQEGAYQLLVAGASACELQAGEGVIVWRAMPGLRLLARTAHDTLISTRIESASPSPAGTRPLQAPSPAGG